LTLSDGFCVDRHRNEFIELIRAGIDILFANESEIKSLYQTESFDLAAKTVSNDVRLAALTRSEKGSVIFADGKSIEIASEKIPAVVDTTGAGDLYAAGFLFGYSKGFELPVCGQLASLAAAEIIGHIGARPEVSLAELAHQRHIV